ncbi:MAG TPA: 1-deoxy-D-xylulose-5-phosphate reductoisomerase, partial [Marinobacter sp.]|nr:1-deoxy-D-xylulose-5-phosphate reductoisomerase [Marinobacter sp.]
MTAVIRHVTLLGATGSIGLSTLDVVRRHPDRFRVHALTASSRDADMETLCREFLPRYAVMADPDAAVRLRERLGAGSGVEVLAGVDGLCQVASDPAADTVMAAIVGAAGLSPT